MNALLIAVSLVFSGANAHYGNVFVKNNAVFVENFFGDVFEIGSVAEAEELLNEMIADDNDFEASQAPEDY